MTPELEIGMFFVLTMAIVGCYKYVHDNTTKTTRALHEFMLDVVARLSRIEAILNGKPKDSKK